MSIKKFRSEMMGYNKQDVYSYIEELVKTFETTIREKDERIAILTAERDNASRERDGLVSQSQELDSAKKTIADAIINAQEQARRIKEEAYREFDYKKENIEKMVQTEMEALRKAKQDVLHFRNVAKEFLHSVVEKIDLITDTTPEVTHTEPIAKPIQENPNSNVIASELSRFTSSLLSTDSPVNALGEFSLKDEA